MPFRKGGRVPPLPPCADAQRESIVSLLGHRCGNWASALERVPAGAGVGCIVSRAMNEEAFVEKREPEWKRFSFLCDRAEVSPVNLRPEELREFVRLYRRVSSDLALARTRSINPELVDFLNALCARGYGLLYRTPSKPWRKAFGGAVRLAAQTVRRQVVSILVSALLLFGSAGFAALAMRTMPELRSHFISPDDDGIKGWKSGKFEARTGSESIGASGFYSANNPRVAITAGAIAAATFGVGTAFMLYANGTILGALASEMADVGKLGHLIVSIAPHGVTEISGMLVSGAAGLVMGWALISPGRRRRGDALREAGKDAIVMLATAVVLMLLAAPVEGFVSFNPNIPDWAKAGFAIATAVGWGLFWTGYGTDASVS